jgi:hypothetical protein
MSAKLRSAMLPKIVSSQWQQGVTAPSGAMTQYIQPA